MNMRYDALRIRSYAPKCQMSRDGGGIFQMVLRIIGTEVGAETQPAEDLNSSGAPAASGAAGAPGSWGTPTISRVHIR